MGEALQLCSFKNEKLQNSVFGGKLWKTQSKSLHPRKNRQNDCENCFPVNGYFE